MGVREPHIYGTTTLAQIEESGVHHAAGLGLDRPPVSRITKANLQHPRPRQASPAFDDSSVATSVICARPHRSDARARPAGEKSRSEPRELRLTNGHPSCHCCCLSISGYRGNGHARFCYAQPAITTLIVKGIVKTSLYNRSRFEIRLINGHPPCYPWCCPFQGIGVTGHARFVMRSRRSPS